MLLILKIFLNKELRRGIIIFLKGKFIEIINKSEIISEHEGFINSIKWLENGFIVTCSSDKMIFLHNIFNRNNINK